MQLGTHLLSTCSLMAILVSGAPPAPSWSVLPSISGTPTVGQTLTGADGTIANGTVSARRWLRNDVPISGATNSTYTLVAADEGALIEYEVDATGTGGTATEISSFVGPIDPAPVGLSNIPFGDKTRRLRGGFVLGPTSAGTYVLSGAAATAGFTVASIVDENNVSQEMLVIGGTAGTAPPALSGSYSGTITRSGDGQVLAVTVNIIPNAWHVRAKWSDNASTFEARTDGFQHASLVLGDAIILRAGDYNLGADNGAGGTTTYPGVGHDWYFNRATAPTGTWTGSNYVVIKGEGCPASPYNALGRPRPITDYPVRVRRLSITRSGSNIDQYAHVTQIAFYRKLDLSVCPMWVSSMVPAANGYVAYGSRVYQLTGTPANWTTPPQTVGGVTAGWTSRAIVSAGGLLNLGQGANGPGKCKVSKVLFAGDPNTALRHLVDTVRFYGLVATGNGAANNHARELIYEDNAFSGMGRDISVTGDPTVIVDNQIQLGRHVSEHCEGQCLVLNNTFPIRQTAPWIFLNKKAGYRASPWDSTSNVHGDYIYIGTAWTSAMGTFEFGTIGMDPTRTTIHGVIAMRGLGTAADHDGTILMQDNLGTARAQNGLITNVLGIANLVRGPSMYKNDGLTVRNSTFLTDMSPTGVPTGDVGAYMADSATYTFNRNLFSKANGVIEDAALNVTGSFSPTNGVDGLNTLGAIAAVIPGAIYGTDLAGKTEAQLRAAWAPLLNGSAKQGDGTYAGAVKPDGSWNDGAVYP